MSSWQPDNPVELEDGTLVCRAHFQVWCPVCCVDYSFVHEDRDEDEDEDEHMDQDKYEDEDGEDHVLQQIRSWFSDRHNSASLQGDACGRAERFVPPDSSATPQALFSPGVAPTVTGPYSRFIRRSDHRELLIFTDGACLDNGGQNPKAGCAFVFRPATSEFDGGTKFRLEIEGPTGERYPQTSNRAELRAVIAALQFRAWHGEGFSRLVIATDSQYVVNGAMEWTNTWISNGWRTSTGSPVKNRDLWELLLKEISRRQQSGLRIKFWHIPREYNTVADRMAKEAAARDDVPSEFREILGVLV